MNTRIKLLSIVNHPVSSNCYILYDELSSRCLLIDPGSEYPDLIDDILHTKRLYPDYIILTHEHFDHIWGCNYFISKYDSKLICSELCADSIKLPKKNLSFFYNQCGFSINANVLSLEDIGWKLEWNEHLIYFAKAQGHTDGGILFYVNSYLFTGDTLIEGEKTVTKLPTGSKLKLKETILFLDKLKGHRLQVYPGHGNAFDLDSYNLEKTMI